MYISTTEYKGTTIVAPTDQSLRAEWGAGKQIAAMAGRATRDEHQSIPTTDSQGTRCEIGCSCVTTTGDLPTDYCIHAQVPQGPPRTRSGCGNTPTNKYSRKANNEARNTPQCLYYHRPHRGDKDTLTTAPSRNYCNRHDQLAKQTPTQS